MTNLATESSPPATPKRSIIESLGLHRKDLRAWAMYDWGNSAFNTTIVAGVMPLYFAKVAAAPLEPHLRTAYWGYTASIGLVITALAGPLLGILADRYGIMKKMLTAFTAVGILASALLYFVQTGDWVMACVIYTFGFIGVSTSNLFYEALLPHIANVDEIDRVSTAGYALGYLGGGILLAINMAWIVSPATFGFADAGVATRASFVSVAVWWTLFTIPLLRHVSEPVPTTPRAGQKTGVGDAISTAVRQLGATLREIRNFKQAFLFLLAFWAYNDGIGTIIKMATIYGDEVGIGTSDLMGALVLVQFVGVPFSFAFGMLAGRIGTKNGIYLSLWVYVVICLLGFFMEHAWQFWTLAILVGLVQGGSQALSRSLYATIIPTHRSAEFFGFFSISSKFAGIFGPLVFAMMTQLAGGSRASILVLTVFFIVGIALLAKVDVAKGREEALAATPRGHGMGDTAASSVG